MTEAKQVWKLWDSSKPVPTNVQDVLYRGGWTHTSIWNTKFSDVHMFRFTKWEIPYPTDIIAYHCEGDYR